MEDGWELYLIYLAFIPLSILLVLLLLQGLGQDLIFILLGFSLTIGSFVVYKYSPRGSYSTKLAIGVASVAFWAFQFIHLYLKSGFEPFTFVLFVVASYIMFVISQER